MGADWLSSVAQQATKYIDGVALDAGISDAIHIILVAPPDGTAMLEPTISLNKDLAADGRYMAAYKLLTASGQQHGITYNGMVTFCQEQGLGNFTRLQVGLLAACLS